MGISLREKLILWKNGKLKIIEDNDLRWIHDVRQIAETEVQILTDPWRDGSAIWLFDVQAEDKKKILEDNARRLFRLAS